MASLTDVASSSRSLVVTVAEVGVTAPDQIHSVADPRTARVDEPGWVGP